MHSFLLEHMFDNNPLSCSFHMLERFPRRHPGWSLDVESVGREGGREVVRLRLDRDADLLGRAASLSARETECCAFFEFELAITAESAVLTVTSRAGHEDVLAALATRASTLAGRPAPQLDG